MVTKSVKMPVGRTADWEVSAQDYQTQSGSYLMGNAPHTITVNLTPSHYTFTIVPTPSDATVIINGQQRTSIYEEVGTTITWSVSKSHYVTRSGSYVLNQDHTENVVLAEADYDYLTFDILASGNVIWKASATGAEKTIEYSKNDGPWTTITSTTSGVSIPVVAGDILEFCGDNVAYSDSSGNCSGFDSTADFNVRGNIMSLIDSNNFENLTVLDSAGNNFRKLFDSCEHVIDASSLELPATTLAASCYRSMFGNCLNLVTAPILPATTLADSCYYYMFGVTAITTPPVLPATTLADSCYKYMFRYCDSLTTAPALPATTLAESCYSYMFNGCTSLTTAPTLPATTLVNSCYYYMFNGCSSLNYIKCLATNISATYCTRNWVNNVAATGAFVKDANTTWGTGASAIPVGWVVADNLQCTFTIVADPVDATVIINGQQRTSYTGMGGEPITWSVSKNGYVEQSGSYLLIGVNHTENISLLKYCTLTINPTPADATVIIAGEERSSYTGIEGDTVTWSVSKNGYISRSGSVIFTQDVSMSVTLAVSRTFTIVPTPSDATVTINGSPRTTITVGDGDTVTWSVSKNEYVSQSGTQVVTSDVTLNIDLDPQCIIEGTCKSNTLKIGYNRVSNNYYYDYSLFDITFTYVSANKYNFVARASGVVTSLASAFSLSGWTQSGWDAAANAAGFLTITSMRGTDKCTDASSLFGRCTSMTSINLSAADFSKVTNVDYMYRGLTACTSMVGPRNLKPTTAQSLYSAQYNNAITLINANDMDWSSLTYNQNNMNKDGARWMFHNCNVTNYDLSNLTINSSLYRAFDHAGKAGTPIIINMENTTFNHALYRIFGDEWDVWDDGSFGPLSNEIYIYIRRTRADDPNLINTSLSSLSSGFWHKRSSDSSTDNPVNIGVFPWGNPNQGSAYVGEFYVVYSNYEGGSPIITNGYHATTYTNGYVSLNISGMTKDGIPDGHGGYVMPTVNFSAGPNGAYNLSAYNWKTGSSYRYNYWYNTTGTTIRYSVSAPGFTTVTGTATPQSGSSTSTGGTQTINITLTPTS